MGEAAEKSQKKEDYEGYSAPSKTEEKTEEKLKEETPETPKEEPTSSGPAEGIKALFNSADVNKDGFLSKAELANVFTYLDPNFDKSTMDELYSECDIDGDCRVCINEFIDSLFPEESKVKEIWTVRKAFNQVDKNGDGYVSIAELKHCEYLPPVFTEAFGGL